MREGDYYCMVYPSWASLCYEWKDLARILANPMTSGFLDTLTDWEACGYNTQNPEFKLYDGHFGGGIISIDKGTTTKTLVRAALMNDTNFCEPVGTGRGNLQPSTRYLEPRDGPLSDIPFAPPALRKRHRAYTCLTIAEAVDFVETNMLVFCGTKMPASLFGDELFAASARFGMNLSSVDISGIESNIRTVLSRLSIASDSIDLFCYEVTSAADLNFLHAVLVYLAYHAASTAKKKLVCACLLMGSRSS